MKKLLITIILFFLVPQINFAQSTLQEHQKVFITASGSKYHSAGCSYLKKSSIERKLSEVQGSYSACSRCLGSSSSSGSSTKQSFLDGRSGETTKSGATIHTGPRGGKYYYNKNGKKTYVRKKK